ncbi:hypothetical protein CBP33_11970 [Acidovorax carolinensis]|nr:hypothetical protein CBP33_11970 [Acidovorax carolinensis]
MLEKVTTPVNAPGGLVHFIRPGHGTVAMCHMPSGLSIERQGNEIEAQFMVRAALVMKATETDHGNQS